MADTNGDPTPDRLAQLERENARLREELDRVTSILGIEQRIHDAYALRELPLTIDEVRRVLGGEEYSITDLIAEVERDLGRGGSS